ncbi:MAG: Mor transcription activator family protein [Pseudomonadota bacterium]
MVDSDDIRIEDLPPDFREVAEAIGLDPALRLVEARGGEALYVPKLDKVARLARNRAIRDEFSGANHRELARKYNLTVVMIRQSVGAAGADPDTDSRRMLLPGF